MRRPRPTLLTSLHHTSSGRTFDSSDTQRALQDAGGAIERLQQGDANSEVLEVDLVAGVNKFNHGLGRVPRFVAVCPTVASAAFAYAMASGNPVPSLQLWLELLGPDQPRCKVWIT